ncbi:MAG: cyclic nucleotide-binding domain-containing protein [Desulfuromonadales bacterium]|nr:cyclic nucleotide-binding domain-containing protein [Desulfuromonadales bacterium]
MDPLWNNIFKKGPEEDSLAFFLKHLPIFSELSPKALRILENVVHLRNYKANEIIFEEGDPGSGMYMVRSGSVKIFSRSINGSEDELANLTTGDFFGETTLTAPAPRSASARTLDGTELVGLFRADLLELAERYPAVSSSILLGMTRVVSEKLQAASLEIRRLQHQTGQHIAPENVET